MIVLTFTLLTLLLSLWSLAITLRAGSRAPRYSWHRTLLGFALAAFIYCFGAWTFISVYARSVLALAWIGSFGVSLALKHIITNDYPRRKKRGNIIAAILLLALTALYYTGSTGKAETLDLHFPFRSGTYALQQGGKGLPSNIFHVSARNAIYAMDWVKLNRFGNRANALFSKTLTDYYTFGDTVISPCNGLVQRIVDDNPDNIPPVRKRGPHNLNSVVIETPTHYIFMGHFKEGSAMVKVGDTLVSGQPIALAGNSGMSLEPHLHIQAHRKANDGPWYRQPPVFILFEGIEYRPSDMLRTR